MQKFEYTVLDMIEQASRVAKTAPINLGGVGGAGGGVGVPPGGFVGRLPQWAVAYDTLEAAASGTLPSGVTGASGWSLVDNLNHIRYRLDVIESGGVGGAIIVQDWDGTPTINPTSKIIFSGATVVDLGGGNALVVVGSGAGGGLDETTANGLYLRLDTANAPLTNELTIIPSTNGVGALYLETNGDAFTLDSEQYTVGTDVNSPNVQIYQEIGGAGNFNAGANAILGLRGYFGAGSFNASWLKFRKYNDDQHVFFEITASGHAYDNGELLITEAPINGSAYNRKNGAWVVASGGGSSSLTVMDADATPTINNVDTIIFSGAIVQDLGSGDVLVTISGGAGNTYYGVRSYTDQSGGTSDTYGNLSGTINGSNTVFTVAQGVYSTGTLRVYLNGQLQTQGTGEDWTETSPAAGTFTFAVAPIVGDTITAIYNTTGAATTSALVVEEADGAPSVSMVDKIIFSGASVTSLGSGDVLVAIPKIFTFTMEGTLATNAGKIRMYNNYGHTLTITKVFLAVDTPPTGAAIIVDINKGGTTIFTTQANRPQIAIGANTGFSTTINVPTFADGEYLTMDIDQKGSGTAGADLSVQVVFA